MHYVTTATATATTTTMTTTLAQCGTATLLVGAEKCEQVGAMCTVVVAAAAAGRKVDRYKGMEV